ncbi:SLIT-ROBO Rho GTPase-activating protein 3 isoform X1 [Astyanax mexicanus]|uniref:SLIT-ROBO Rho GTPase-activating protein 3 isoform X1 n=1 Tax=Astyanax mexicanus TaxID=7994 RepID=A0A8T2LHZ3_ASTMX|nr:SLIT-ROBO Rho GTPase-activating protein 3 isoform X1 [Astyanax mexicanus]
MSSHGKLRKEKGSLAEYENQIKEVRSQLSEQLKVLDAQLEQKTQQLQDLSDYLRRRGEIEAEYARSLEKLSERFTLKTKKKEQSDQSVAQSWTVLLTQTKQESRDHSSLSELCSTTLTQRLTHCIEDTHRLAKKSKEVGLQMQDELLKVTTELQTALKTYHQYHTECLAAEGKLKEATRLEERQTGKSSDLGLGQSAGQRRSSVKKIERLMEKRQGKVQETQLKCTKARNDYLLNLAAANAAMNKYYLEDICTLIDCTDLGYHLSVSRVMRGYLSNRNRAQQNLKNGLQQLDASVNGLDQSQDRDALLQAHNTAFCLPFRFQHQAHEGDQVCEVSADCQVRYEMETRFQQLQSRLASVTLETEEVSKTLKATHTALLDNICDDDCNPTPDISATLSLESTGDCPGTKQSLAKRRANQQETEIYYFTKVKEYMIGSSLISKLQAKHDLLKEAIQKVPVYVFPRMQPGRAVRVRKARPCSQYNHKLFTGDMISFIQSSGQQIPLVVESCIRFINLHGLHHEGIFRVPGSQSEVNHIRDAFERGEDPLTDSECDIDSVAGVLKLYFRGLEKPLFPEEFFNQLMECVQIENMTERAAQIKTVVSSFPRPIIIVMRYLFAFLHHVSQYSDENMMQPYNLAVCFGPSLLRGAESGDAVTLQPQINALVKTLILQHESIFPGPSELPGPVYEKCMTLEQEYCEPITEEGEGDAEHVPSEDEWEAVALFDYVARSAAELSFKQGDHVTLHSKASADWWRGEVGGVKGLIPHKYISISEGAERKQERGKREDTRGGSTGNLNEEQQQSEHSTRMRVNSDSASLPGRQRTGSGGGGGIIGGGSSGNVSPVRKLTLQVPEGRLILPPQSPGATRQVSGSQERRHTLDSLRPIGGPADRQTVHVDKEISRQMNSVFKELLSRQPPQESSVPPSPSTTPSSSTPSASTGANRQSVKKVSAFSLRGRGLFKPPDQQD